MIAGLVPIPKCPQPAVDLEPSDKVALEFRYTDLAAPGGTKEQAKSQNLENPYATEVTKDRR